MKSRRLLWLCVLVAGVAVAVPVPSGQAQAPRVSAAVLDALTTKAQSEGLVRVIVGLDTTFRAEGELAGTAVTSQRATIQTAGGRVRDAVSVTGVADFYTFETIPFAAMRVSAASLSVLARTPGVLSIQEDVPVPLNLADSTGIVQATDAWAAGYTGSGWSVAVIDTGVQKSHTFLSGKVVSEACYSLNATCPGGVTESTAAGSGEPGTGNNHSTHGTHVAGIAAGTGSSFSGVARGANIVALQTFSFISGCGVCTYSSDYIKALQRVLAIHGTFNIAAVNMSLGGGGFTSQATCDSNNAAAKAAIDNLRSVGVATVIASGNDRYTNAVSSPGCISSAVSVGSTTKFDTVVSTSNTASFLNLLAPGSSIRSSVTGGGSDFAFLGGTSMAAPHVAGAWAVIKAAKPSASVSEVLGALRSTGTLITDSKAPTITVPRINIRSALRELLPESAPCSFSISPSSVSVGAESGSGSVSLTASGGGCGWTASGSSAAWLSIVPGYTSGTGSATVRYQFTANTSTQGRTATVEVAGRILTVTQSGTTFRGCCDGNGDGRTDLYWRNSSNGQLAIWFMNGRTLIDSQMLSPTQVADLNWRIEAVMDIDSDGDGDLIWRHATTGDLAVWVMNGRTLVDSWALSPGRVADLNWRIVGSGDFNGDGKPDLFWHHNTTGELAVWYMDGRTLINSVYTSHFVADLTWRVVAVDDMDGDGDADLIWRNTGNGEMAIWFMNGRTLADSYYLSVRFVTDANWKVVGSGDFNADGRIDLIWQHDGTGDVAAWYMNGRTLIDSVALSPGRVIDLNWKIVGPR